MANTRAHWGPYGWKTLHSVAALYPDAPSVTDKGHMRNWMESFASTITCPTCQVHFKDMLHAFGAQTDIYASRHALFWFSIKVHNMVNARMGKGQIVRYADAYEAYKAKDELATRQYYYRYISQVAVMEQGVDGMVVSKRVGQMSRLDAQLFQSWFKSTDWNATGIAQLLLVQPDVTCNVPLEAVAQFNAVKSNSVLPGAGQATGGRWSLTMLRKSILRR
jgi:hypothetical protein